MTTVWAVYFSGTGTTERTVTHIAGELARLLAAPCRSLDFTRPQARQQELNFCQSDLVVLGTPVYAGRVPNVLLPFLREKVPGRGRRWRCRWCCSAASAERWGCSASIIKRSIGIFAMASRFCWWCSCCCWERERICC